MSGEWAMNRGVLVDIPINGGPEICFAAVEPKNALNPLVGGGDHGGCVNEGKTTLAPGGARFAFPRTAAQPVLGFHQKGGGIPGAAVISAMGSGPGPASFTIPDGAFSQLGMGTAVTVQLAPTVVQLNTTLDAQGPANPAQAAGAIPRFDVQQPAHFMANAWSMDPGQTAPLTTMTTTTTSMTGSPPTNTVTNTNYLGPGIGIRASQVRGAPNFTWCPATAGGIGAGVCIGTLGSKPGPVDGRVRYVAGANRFGGTMAMLLKGFGTTSVRFPDIIVPATTMTPAAGGPGLGRTVIPAVAHLTFAMANTFMNPQANGVGYAFNNTIQLSGAPIHLDFKTSQSAVVGNVRVYAGTGLITASGPVVGSAPGDTNNNWGFPWTTGAVSVRAKELSPGSGPGTHTLTGQGADSRTVQGKGKITLVAGGTANRVLSGADFQALEVLTLNFKAPPATPSMGPAGLSTVALLMALSAGYAIRRRFDSSEK
ncbi:MAG: hypothetical protein JRG94_20575 [Deltaproteobacteria bacterium]|nr:hypothetical protein [Deltaproteobacteria bacterium]